MDFVYISSGDMNQQDALGVRIKSWQDHATRYNLKSTFICSNSSFDNNNSHIVLRIFDQVKNMILLFVKVMLHYRCVRDAKLVIISWPPYIPVLLSTCIVAQLNKNMVIEVRDPYPDVIADKYHSLFISLILKGMRYLNNYIFSRAKFILITDLYSRLESMINFKEKCIFSPNGSLGLEYVTTKQFGCKLRVVHLGKIGKFQDLARLSAAVNQLNSINIIETIDFIGDEPPKKLSHLSKVRYLGYVKPEQIYSKLSTYDIGISFRDASVNSDLNIPVRVFEYAQARLAILTNQSSGMSWFRENYPKVRIIMAEDDGSELNSTVKTLDGQEDHYDYDFSRKSVIEKTWSILNEYK